jgi:hypothetical protein
MWLKFMETADLQSPNALLFNMSPPPVKKGFLFKRTSRVT